MGQDDSVEELMKEGFELVEAGQYKSALKVGKGLLKRRHTSGFEISALAYAGLDKVDKAVNILEEGVEKAPVLWVLWQLLGNYRSDLGKFDEALAAYRRALICPDVDESSVELNISILLGRQEHFEKALEHLEKVVDAELMWRAASQRLFLLNKLGRHDEAIQRGLAVIDKLTDEVDREQLAAVEAKVGEAYWIASKDRETALNWAWKAAGHCATEPTAMWLIRHAQGKISASARYYRMLLEGDWPEPGEDGRPLGYFISLDVVANSPEEALEYARPFEIESLRDSLRIHECKDMEPRPHDQAGVYSMGGHHLFPRDQS